MKPVIYRLALSMLVIALCTRPASAAVANMSGTWKLNIEKSDSGKRPKPKDATLKIEHKDPSLKFSLTGTAGDGKPIKVEFKGKIDGKEYPVEGSPYTAKASLTRVDDSTVKGVGTSADGKAVETYTVSVSKDGKTLTRKGTVKGPAGEFGTLYIYEKK